MQNNRDHAVELDIPIATILKVLATIVVVGFLYLIKDVLVLFFVSLLLAAALNPSVGALKKRGVPISLAILSLYAVILGAFALIIILLIPAVANEIAQLSGALPDFAGKFFSTLTDAQALPEWANPLGGIDQYLETIQNVVKSTAGGVVSTLIAIFGGAISFILVLVITFYLLVEERALIYLLSGVLPQRTQPYVAGVMARMQVKIGQWVRGQIILCLIIGAAAFVGLWAFGIPYALVLGLWAGLTEFIPYLGPYIGAIPAVFFGFTQSLWQGVAVLILYIIIQQAENNFIVPRVMQKTVGLNPIITIFVLLIGAQLGGIVGTLIAVPVTTAVGVLVEDLFNHYAPQRAKEEDRTRTLTDALDDAPNS